jgi:hypothetical protein
MQFCRYNGSKNLDSHKFLSISMLAQPVPNFLNYLPALFKI